MLSGVPGCHGGVPGSLGADNGEPLVGKVLGTYAKRSLDFPVSSIILLSQHEPHSCQLARHDLMQSSQKCSEITKGRLLEREFHVLQYLGSPSFIHLGFGDGDVWILHFSALPPPLSLPTGLIGSEYAGTLCFEICMLGVVVGALKTHDLFTISLATSSRTHTHTQSFVRSPLSSCR